MREGVIREVHDNGQRLSVQFAGEDHPTEIRLTRGMANLHRPKVGQVVRQEPQGHVSYGIAATHFGIEEMLSGPDKRA